MGRGSKLLKNLILHYSRNQTIQTNKTNKQNKQNKTKQNKQNKHFKNYEQHYDKTSQAIGG